MKESDTNSSLVGALVANESGKISRSKNKFKTQKLITFIGFYFEFLLIELYRLRIRLLYK